MKTLQFKNQQASSGFFSNQNDVIRYTGWIYIYFCLLYSHVALAILGWLPYWSLLLSLPVLVVRWILTFHELFHVQRAREIDRLLSLFPLILSPFSLGYREYQDIHHRHHAFMVGQQDPELYLVNGNPLSGFLNALTTPEQSFFRWIAERGMDGPLLRDTLIRLGCLVGMVALTGWAFLWYWIPVRLVYGLSIFVFFYCVHRRGETYGVYPLLLPVWADRLVIFLFSREAWSALCNHDLHHQNPRVAARHLPRVRQ